MKYSILSFVAVLVSNTFLNTIIIENDIWPRHTIDNLSSGADGVRLADVSNDGLMDITTGWEEGGLTKVYLHPGYENVRKGWPSVVVGKTPDVEDAVFADLNNDGAMDVISCTEGKNRKIYVNWAPDNPHYYLNAQAWNTEVMPASDGVTQWMFAASAQLDGKNGIDIIAGSKGKDGVVGWFESPQNAEEIVNWIWHPISPATWIMSIILSDMDQDGNLDVVISDRKPGSTNGVRWLENPGAANMSGSLWKNHFIGAQELEVMFMDMSDLDGDGLEDVIACERTNQKIIIWKRLDQTGIHWRKFEINIPDYVGSAKAVKIGDLNNDLHPDIVLSTNTNNDDTKNGIVWLTFQDNNTFKNVRWNQLSDHIGYKFDRLELLDLDGDGDLDVLTCEENYGPDSQGLGVIWYENPIN